MVNLPKLFIAIPCVSLTLSACVSDAPPVGTPLPSKPAPCMAADFAHLKWQPESYLRSVTLPKGTRVLLPDMAATTDYRPDRLNIGIGKLGRVERIYCG